MIYFLLSSSAFSSGFSLNTRVATKSDIIMNNNVEPEHNPFYEIQFIMIMMIKKIMTIMRFLLMMNQYRIFLVNGIIDLLKRLFQVTPKCLDGTVLPQDDIDYIRSKSWTKVIQVLHQ